MSQGGEEIENSRDESVNGSESVPLKTKEVAAHAQQAGAICIR